MTAKDDILNWVNTYTKDLFAYTFSKVQQKEVAEDIVQDTILSAYQSYEKFEGKSNAKTWLFSVLKHKIADYFRLKYKAAKEVHIGIIEQFFDENDRWKSEYRPQNWWNEKALLDDPEFAKVLEGCLDQLPEKWSYAVKLKYLEEQDSLDICNRLEITKANFWQIMHRAKLQLRNCLELKWFKR